MTVHKLTRLTVREDAFCEIHQVDVRKTPNGYQTKSGRRISALDAPDIKLRIVVYSEQRDTRKLDRLCAKIRKAVEEYKKR